ncbi:hypothetical protein GYMLUDRAFT_33940 [Collybiopsis luxurians FD-317 M1]|nr:hypothetical protein GYMLUDRAFT_33940 [Collybiopsis luxurians FD-317 M1]
MFETTNLRLRAVRETDFPKLLDLWNDYRVQKTLSSGYVVPKGVKFEETLRAWAADALFNVIIETKDTCEWVGQMNLFDHKQKDRQAMLGMSLLPEFWGRGYATEALRFFIDHTFRELGLHRVVLGVMASNIAARKVYKKVGFVEEGVQRKANWANGEWQDAISMAILDEDWEASKQEST